MIKYLLKCTQEHEFEVWFNKSADYETQRKKRQIICPMCSSTKISKAPMAPNIKKSKGPGLEELAAKIRKDISENCDDVGDKFADEARAIHYGEKPERGIYGHASAKDAKDLIDEGVGIAPLPDALAPIPKKKLN